MILPSVVGPVLDTESTLPAGVLPSLPVVLTPTDSTFFAVAGAVTDETPVPSQSPTENMGRTVLSSLTN